MSAQSNELCSSSVSNSHGSFNLDITVGRFGSLSQKTLSLPLDTVVVDMGLPYVLLKALPPVCMKYTARGESRVANIALGEAECYICHETLTKSCIFHTNKVSVL